MPKVDTQTTDLVWIESTLYLARIFIIARERSSCVDGVPRIIYKMEHLLVAFRGLSTVMLLWKTGAFRSMQEGEGGGAAEAETKPRDEHKYRTRENSPTKFAAK